MLANDIHVRSFTWIIKMLSSNISMQMTESI